MATSSNASNNPHRFSADRPLTKVSEDRLDRAEFARRLASDIFAWHGDDSLVISLNGDWGSGKSTLKNFVKDDLKGRGAPVIVEFNPWEWSGQQKLLEAFFLQIGLAFKKTDASADTKKLAEKWAALEAWTRLGAEISARIEKAVTPLVGGSITVALLASTTSIPWLHGPAIGLAITGVVASAFFAVFPEIAARFVAVFDAEVRLRRRTLVQLREEITAELLKLRGKHRPVLVIIDDIDRLTRDEIRLLFQLVKANMDFPNLTFLLLFQKSIVADALEQVITTKGAEYLKKIVQVEFDVPQASRTRMLQIMQDGLTKIVETKTVKMHWDQKRVGDIFGEFLWPYFQTLRDVKRFLGTFDFYFQGHVSHGVLEVNPIDLLAIEVLRSFDHDSYLAIRDSLGMEGRGGFAQMLFSRENQRKQRQEKIDALLARPGLSKEQKQQLGGVLNGLFPSDIVGDSNFMANAERALRICHPAHFKKYFENVLHEEATSAASIDAMIKLVSQRDAFAARLRKVTADAAIEDVFQKLELYFNDIPVEAAESFAGALFDVADELPQERISLFGQDPVVEAAQLVYRLLSKLPDNVARWRTLQAAMTSSSGVILPVTLTSLLEHKKKKADTDSPFLDPTEFAHFRKSALDRIVALAHSGHIWENRHFGNYLYRWREWADQQAVNAWIQTALSTPERKLEFLTKMMSRSLINGQHEERFLHAKSLEDFVDLEDLAAAIEPLSASNINERAQEARDLLNKALQLKKSGHDYSDVRQRGDFDPMP